MKHFTCDKCGMPMNRESITRINNKNYEICCVCEKEILKGLDGKGQNVQSILPNINGLDYYKKDHWGKDKYFLNDAVSLSK